MTKPKNPFTATGQPRLGGTLTLRLHDGTTEDAKIVGKGWGKHSRDLVVVWLEWSDGTRQPCPWPELKTAMA